MRRKLAPRIQCAVCSTDFPRRGGKRTCSDHCRSIYARQRSKRKPEPTPRLSPPTSMKYVLDRIAVTEAGCWEWQQSLNPKTGYGQIGFRPYTAHRLAFYFAHGRYPNGLTRHSCHNRACCNPDHLTEGTHADNWNDSEAAYRAHHARLRGRRAHNAIPITIEGVTYPSKSAAAQALHVAWSTLARISDQAPVSGLPSKQTSNR